MVGEKKYDKGQLVRILVCARECTEEGFALYGVDPGRDHSLAIFYESIDLFSYPSCNDFSGKQTVVRHGDLATVLSFKGRPFQIHYSSRWDCYDVYEVLINGNVCQVFKHNLEPTGDCPALYPKPLEVPDIN